jgi:hypothetical protein
LETTSGQRIIQHVNAPNVVESSIIFREEYPGGVHMPSNETLYPHEQIAKRIIKEINTTSSIWIGLLAISYSVLVVELLVIFVLWYIPLYISTPLSWPPMYWEYIRPLIQLVCMMDYLLIIFGFISVSGKNVN